MYAGHAGIALVLKSRAPNIPIVPLALACYGPDWVDAALMIPQPRAGMAPYSHSLPALVIGAVVAGSMYFLLARRPGAMLVALGWLLHWPADLLTGLKPIFGLTPMVGFDLYHMPIADFALEAAVIVMACAIYARAVATERRHRSVIVALAVALIVIQGAFDVAVSQMDGSPWRPSLAFTQ